jgi:hypothetical protein
MVIFHSYVSLPEGRVGAVLQKVGKHTIFPKRYVWRMDLRKQQKWNETDCIKSVGQSHWCLVKGAADCRAPEHSSTIIYQLYPQMGVSWNRGTPQSSMLDWYFPQKKTSSYWGISSLSSFMETLRCVLLKPNIWYNVAPPSYKLVYKPQ